MEEKPNPYRAPGDTSRVKHAPAGNVYGRVLFRLLLVYLCLVALTLIYSGICIAMTMLGYDPPFHG
jgi:hypothetical protein